MQLQSLLISSTRAIPYTLDMLADDLQSGLVSGLLVQDPNNGVDTEIRTSSNPSFRRLRDVLKEHPIRLMCSSLGAFALAVQICKETFP